MHHWHLTRTGGPVINLKYVRPDIVKSLFISDTCIKPTPSKFLCDNLSNKKKLWVFSNEVACTIILRLDTLWTDVIQDKDIMITINGYCKVKNDWFGSDIRFTEKGYYMLRKSQEASETGEMDWFAMVCEAKCDWQKTSLV
jgi:hypothetical protein